MLWGDPAKRYIIGAVTNQRSAAMANQNDLSRSVVAFEQRNTIIAVIEMSLNSWLVAGIVPGIERHPLKKLSFDEEKLLKLLYRWRDEAVKAGHTITRIVVAFEAGRDGFWLARWLRTRSIEAYVIHPTSVAVSREHRRAKTDRLDRINRQLSGWILPPLIPASDAIPLHVMWP
jgi:transposase